MKKFYLVFLVFILLFIPATNAVAVYQLDQPVKELDNYTLREVFENRNMAMPDLTGATEISTGVYRFYDNNGITIDYDVYSGVLNFNGSNTGVINDIIFNIEQNTEYTLSFLAVSGTLTGGAIRLNIDTPAVTLISQTNENVNKNITFNSTTQTLFRINMSLGRTFTNYKFRLQLEKGSTATPYQVPTNGPYSDVNIGLFGLTNEEIQIYYDLYLEAVRFEIENIEASQDPGGYQNIFKSVINGVKGLIVEMGNVWQFLNAPIITSEMSDYSFSIDWSWDLIGVVRQLINSLAILILQTNFIFINLLFSFTGIPVQISILSMIFSNFVFVILGWIIVKSFII